MQIATTLDTLRDPVFLREVRASLVAWSEDSFADAAEEAGEAMEGQLIRLMEQLPEQGMEQEEPWAESLQLDEPEAETPGSLDAQAEQRIERLFDRADRDRSLALELKRELDRLGVFERYEDRFLDLFRKGE